MIEVLSGICCIDSAKEVFKDYEERNLRFADNDQGFYSLSVDKMVHDICSHVRGVQI